MVRHLKLAVTLLLLAALMTCAFAEDALNAGSFVASEQSGFETNGEILSEAVEERIGEEVYILDDGILPEETLEPSPEPTPEVTEEPPVEPTAEPTPEATEEPTPEATEEPSVEPTAEPTPEATVEPTPQATPEPVPEPTAEPVPEEIEDTSEKLTAEAENAVNRVTLGVGEKYSLPAVEGDGEPVYTTSNKKMATVSAKGVIKGKKRGSATVAVTCGETRAEYAVKVVKAPKSVKFTAKALTLGYDAGQGLGEQAQLKVKLTAGSSSGITYYGYNRKVVAVSADGVITAVGTGTTKVYARTYNKKKAKISVTVRPAPTGIFLKTTELSLALGHKYTMKWTVPKKTASKLGITSDNPGVAAVTSKGVITGVSEGTANITFACFNGIRATCAVTVLPAPEPIALASTSLFLGLGEKSAPLLGTADPASAYGGVTFTTSNKKVATVSARGVVKAKKRGTATIRIKAGNGSKASVSVRVYKAPTGLTLSQSQVTVEQYTGFYLTAALPANQAGAVTYTSSNAAVAEVDATGFVAALDDGSALITARTYNGKSATCVVVVTAPSVEIHMADVARVSTSKDTYFPIEVLRTNGEVYDGPVKITIDPSDVAEYRDGRLTGLIGGQTAVLTVVVGDTDRSCAVIVEDSATALDVRAIAHRGSAHWPENTLEAFANFASTGADGVELDIRSTSDGVQVILHDASYWYNGVEYYLAEQTYETNRAMVESLCTLDEALDVIAKTGKEIYMNPKETADGAKCVKAIRDRGLQSRTLYLTGDEALLQSIYAADNTALLGLTLSAGSVSMGDEVANRARALHAAYIVLHKSLVNAASVDYWHGLGYKVCAWTVNDKKTMAAVCAVGVDSVLTDYPEYCIEARKRG